jgi:hypothetical protein
LDNFKGWGNVPALTLRHSVDEENGIISNISACRINPLAGSKPNTGMSVAGWFLFGWMRREGMLCFFLIEEAPS